MHDPNCMYCVENDTLHNLMFYVCEVEQHKVYLFKNQCYNGRCIVACKDHVRCVHDMTPNDVADYFKAVQKVGKAIDKLYNPKQINYATFGDGAGHVHCHLVPKYPDGPDFGNVFQMNPEPGVYLAEDEYQKRIQALQAELL